MTAISPYALITAGARERFGRSVRAIEKVRPRARFNDEHDPHREPQSWICVPYARGNACQSGTSNDGSFRDTRMLTAEFAAQVIGQTMPADACSASAGAAYRNARFVLAPLFDKNV